MARQLLLALAALITAARAQETPVLTTICEIGNNPAAFQHKLVQVTAITRTGFEFSILSDLSCPDSPVPWFEFGGSTTTPRTVEGISVAVKVDERFSELQSLYSKSGMVHGTFIGRFFAGSPLPARRGKVRWGGYGHLGGYSLFVLQQVLSVDPHNLPDVDYADFHEDFDRTCGPWQIRHHPETPQRTQKRAEATSPWMFTDPRRVAFDALVDFSEPHPVRPAGLRLAHGASGYRIYVYNHAPSQTAYEVRVSRPYLSSFYAANRTRIAWMPLSVAKRPFC